MSYKAIAALALLCGALAGCGDRCSEYSKYSCDEIQQATYNVYYTANGADQPTFVDTVSGLENCGYSAHRFASGRGQKTDDGWGYVCCMKTAKSECAEKHR